MASDKGVNENRPDDLADEEWALVLRLARAALEIPTRDRAAFVGESTNDTRVVGEVLELAEVLENPEADEPGQVSTTVGRFELIDYLGFGAFGEVYSAHDPDLLRTVAIKILKPGVYARREQEQRFLREARAISALNHPNIVTIHEVIRTEVSFAIVMELVSGETLRKKCAGDLSVPQIVELACQLADGLAFAHAGGVTHRDIKPENVMVMPDGRAKLLDFGLARSSGLGSETGGSVQSGLAGTPRYMSPEHYKNEPLTAKSDVFALGLVLYELSTGSHPFPAGSPFEALHRIAVDDPEPPSRANPAITPDLEALITAMMCKDPAQRPTAAQVRDGLQGVEGSLQDRSALNHGIALRSPRDRADNSAAPAAAPKRRAASLALRLGVLLACLLLAITLMMFAVQFLRRPAAKGLQIMPLAGNAGLETSPSFSPDSKQVAYSWDGNRRNFSIYLKAIGDGSPHRLTESFGHDIDPAWSPDSQKIAFLRVLPERSEVVLIPSAGGIELVLDDSASSVRWHADGPEDTDGAGPVWAPNGRFLIASCALKTRGLRKLFLDGRREQLTQPPPGTCDGSASISPSGKFVAFKRVWAFDSSDLYVVAVEGGAPRRLTFAGRDIEGVAWLDNDEILYSSNQAGSYQLWRVRGSGGNSSPFAVGGSQPHRPALSRDGRWIAFVEPRLNAAIWRTLLPESLSKPLETELFISSAGMDHSPDYSPDGKKIVFVSDRSGSAQLWTSDSDGSGITQLTSFGGSSLGSPHWSPDNRRIAFDGVTTGETSIWLINADGSNLHRLNNDSTRGYMPQWSRDGHWLYYSSLGGSSDRLIKQNPDTGEMTTVANNSFFEAKELQNGLGFYAQAMDSSLWYFPFSKSGQTGAPQLTALKSARYWTPKGNVIYFVRDEGHRHVLAMFDLISKMTRELGEIRNDLLIGSPGLAVDPANHFILVVQRDEHRSSIMLQER